MKRVSFKEGVREPCACTVGNFEGIHLGHQKLIKEVLKFKGLRSCLITFEPPTSYFFKGECRLNTLEEKEEVLRDLGLDYLVVIDFNDSFAKLSAKEFLRLLKERINLKVLVVGYDWRFGRKREGNYELLKKFNLEVKVLEPVLIKGKVVKSSLIRGLLKEGKVEEVKEFLGRPYTLKRKVLRGKGLGKSLGFPTANLEKSQGLCLKEGVYVVRVEDRFLGLANYGIRPTFNGREKVLEVHILNFSGDLVGKTLKVEFLKFLREERKFPSKEELIRQIKKDLAVVKESFNL